MAKGDLRQGSASLREVLELMLIDMGLEDKMREARVLEAVPGIFGEALMSRIDDYYVHNGKLFIRTASAPLRNELFLLKEAILQKLREAAGKDVVVDIILR